MNPNWETCESMKCLYKYRKIKNTKKYGTAFPNKNNMQKIGMLSLLLWQGHTKKYICQYLDITPKELSSMLCPRGRRMPSYAVDRLIPLD